MGRRRLQTEATNTEVYEHELTQIRKKPKAARAPKPSTVKPAAAKQRQDIGKTEGTRTAKKQGTRTTETTRATKATRTAEG